MEDNDIESNSPRRGSSSNETCLALTASRGRCSHFPTQLHIMLSQAQDRGFKHICSWDSHGRAFRVHDRQAFVDDVMPRYFRGTRFGSFHRQLNLYGFTARGADRGAFHHEMFLRDKPDQCRKIARAAKATNSEVRAGQIAHQNADFDSPVSSNEGKSLNLQTIVEGGKEKQFAKTDNLTMNSIQMYKHPSGDTLQMMASIASEPQLSNVKRQNQQQQQLKHNYQQHLQHQQLQQNYQQQLQKKDHQLQLKHPLQNQTEQQLFLQQQQLQHQEQQQQQQQQQLQQQQQQVQNQGQLQHQQQQLQNQGQHQHQLLQQGQQQQQIQQQPFNQDFLSKLAINTSNTSGNQLEAIFKNMFASQPSGDMREQSDLLQQQPNDNFSGSIVLSVQGGQTTDNEQRGHLLKGPAAAQNDPNSCGHQINQSNHQQTNTAAMSLNQAVAAIPIKSQSFSDDYARMPSRLQTEPLPSLNDFLSFLQSNASGAVLEGKQCAKADHQTFSSDAAGFGVQKLEPQHMQEKHATTTKKEDRLETKLCGDLTMTEPLEEHVWTNQDEETMTLFLDDVDLGSSSSRSEEENEIR